MYRLICQKSVHFLSALNGFGEHLFSNIYNTWDQTRCITLLLRWFQLRLYEEICRGCGFRLWRIKQWDEKNEWHYLSNAFLKRLRSNRRTSEFDLHWWLTISCSCEQLKRAINLVQKYKFRMISLSQQNFNPLL